METKPISIARREGGEGNGCFWGGENALNLAEVDMINAIERYIQNLLILGMWISPQLKTQILKPL